MEMAEWQQGEVFITCPEWRGHARTHCATGRPASVRRQEWGQGWSFYWGSSRKGNAGEGNLLGLACWIIPGGLAAQGPPLAVWYLAQVIWGGVY